MCGIAGVFRFAGPVDREPVRAMVRALAHRGPDDEHILDVPQGALGTRRLSIVDRPNGRQPLVDASGAATLAFNGEVYNHTPLRKEFKSNGLEFTTESDTEVLAALTAHMGLSRTVARADGQFGVAAITSEGLFLARDRLGQKPLYWTEVDGLVLFASELKGLLVHPAVRRELDPDALAELLLFEYVPAPRSIYRGIHKLEAGTMLHAGPEGVRIERCWEPPLPGSAGLRHGLAEEKWVDAITTSLRMAVHKRCDTDLPIAICLSGGIDSSAVAALVAQSGRTKQTSFAVTFDEASFDESGPARSVAKHLGLEHVEVPFSSGQLPEVLAALESGMCEPLADGSLAATWLLTRAIRERGFKIAVTGDGADEHFGGYPTYFAHRLAKRARLGAGLLGRVARRLPASRQNLGSGYLARRFTAGLGHPLPRRNQVFLGAFLPEELASLGVAGNPWSTVDRWGAQVDGLDPQDAAMWLDQRLYLGEGVLTKADRASMLNSIELRSPFLDHHLVRLAASLPLKHKVRGRETKVLLRKALAPFVPRDIARRPKKGFGVPLSAWLAGPHRGLIDGLADQLDGLIRGDAVRALVREHLDGHRDHRRRLWTLVTLARWRSGPWGPRT
ncbi:MAG: asparagine synthase (glutamine-hydrolyzing) [Proteobacteria bacterium]|nr:asparagine synthase (glutamine-hydrolyzing) [Pseudomonadota bacterium]MCP4917876.1 asparagine synthase (glutamine-hydrolyzing) [Pseudomonadota bacterium]